MQRLLEQNELVLAEAAVVERLRRGVDVTLHPRLVHAPLIYDAAGRRALEGIYREYIDIAMERGVPVLICTPTWRASFERVAEAGIPDTVNADAVGFLRRIRERQGRSRATVPIGGIVGCRNDCYLPEEGLSAAESERFHAWQIDRLANAGVDFLIAQTLPNVAEAVGIARAMACTGTPWVISFVIDRRGCVLDGTPLLDAVRSIDDAVSAPPLGYMVNCAHPSFLCADDQPGALFDRLIGYLANASALDHHDLNGAGELQADDIAEWGEQMLALNRKHGVKVLGGCCGTGPAHLEYLAAH